MLSILWKYSSLAIRTHLWQGNTDPSDESRFTSHSFVLEVKDKNLARAQQKFITKIHLRHTYREFLLNDSCSTGLESTRLIIPLINFTPSNLHKKDKIIIMQCETAFYPKFMSVVFCCSLHSCFHIDWYIQWNNKNKYLFAKALMPSFLLISWRITIGLVLFEVLVDFFFFPFYNNFEMNECYLLNESCL